LINIRDLSTSMELDHEAMAELRGGFLPNQRYLLQVLTLVPVLKPPSPPAGPISIPYPNIV